MRAKSISIKQQFQVWGYLSGRSLWISLKLRRYFGASIVGFATGHLQTREKMIGVANGAAPAICTEHEDENETSSRLRCQMRPFGLRVLPCVQQ